MPDPADKFRDALLAALKAHMVKGGHQKLDAAVCQVVMAAPDVEWSTTARGFERLLREVQGRMTGPLCMERKQFQRAWVRGAEVGLVRRGMDPHEVVLNLTHLLLLTCYDEGIPIRAFAQTGAWATAQAWITTGGDPEQREAWRSAVLQGVTLALATLRKRKTKIVAGMLAKPELLLETAKGGFQLGSLGRSEPPSF